MALIDLQPLSDPEPDEKLEKKYAGLAELVAALRQKELAANTEQQVNEHLQAINQSELRGKDLRKEVGRTRSRILRLVEKEEKLVPKNHHRDQWMALGMSVFGIPMGIAFGASLDNYAFLGIGLPMGMAIGLAVGSSMDKKAEQEGRQLPVTSNV